MVAAGSAAATVSAASVLASAAASALVLTSPTGSVRSRLAIMATSGSGCVSWIALAMKYTVIQNTVRIISIREKVRKKILSCSWLIACSRPGRGKYNGKRQARKQRLAKRSASKCPEGCARPECRSRPRRPHLSRQRPDRISRQPVHVENALTLSPE